ncbi:MAG: transcriptional regulator [Thermoplasmata archaeon]|jgi:predicted transcriptional regulator|nr:transcriptional regulator [Thermoplasmata archaeon]
MKTPCELVVGRILPSLRASVVKELSVKYNMKQAEIAQRLGITQASVSQYLSAARGGNTEIVDNFPKIKEYASEIAGRIVEGQGRFEWSGVLCTACRDIRADREFCDLHKISANLDGCDVCRK